MDNLSNLEQAVNLFYKSQSTDQAQLNDFLINQQRDPAAWSWLWSFLDFNKSVEVQFFGAVTLHQKLSKNWQEVPQSMHNELKEKILQKIVEFGGAGTKLVLNRLCMSLSAFIVHMLKEWPSALNDVINMFQNQQLPNLSQHTQLWILFDVLSGVPDESCCIFTSIQRVQLKNEVYKNATIVLKTMENFINIKCEKHQLEDEDITSLQNVAKCATTWFKNGSIPLDECMDNLNEDIAFGIYSLFITSIECHSRTILAGICADSPEHHEIYIRVVNEILLCTDKPGIYPVEESCSTLAMGFWFMLQDEILSYDNATEREQCIKAIEPVYAHLVKILVRKSKLPDECNVGKWNSDDLETFRCYRQDIADTLLCCFDVLHVQILKLLSETLDEGIQAIQANHNNWPILEASIHGFCAISQQIESVEYPEIVKLMRVLNEIPYETLNEKLLGTALETMGAYSEWVNDIPKYLPSAIELLVKGLDSPMSSQATLGLKDLTGDCHPQEMIPYAEPLLDACQQSLLKGHLAHPESIRLMYSIGNVLSMISAEKIPNYLDNIISPCFKELQMFAEHQNSSDGARLRIMFCLNMISTLFSSLNVNKTKRLQPMNVENQPQPILLILQKTMPIFKQICDLYINDVVVIENLCKALQQALNNLMDDIKPILNDLCLLILSIFHNRCVPPAIDIAGSCILMFFGDEVYKEPMKQLLLQIIIYNFNVFEQTPPNKFSDISDLMESFYALNSRIVKKIPAAYTQENMDFIKLMEYALKGITLPETGVIKKSASFIATFIKESRNHVNMTNTILMKGEEIVRTVLLCIAGITPRVNVDVFGDVFIALNAKYPSEFLVWMKILETQSFPTSYTQHEEKITFMKNIIKEKVNKRLVNDHIKRFSARCRGLIETSDM
ncbi:CLUMA_CG015289, isoform A [Clunio marinus]|uniref:CLUMA_CG015289, isoform A n=1 Tax=Clunio marinus TaxID=568069 RepID=A0A1J1IQL6_9DIPT|nr:CLUMA_CG015289, isoform A [Clunio marinus]